MIVSYIIPTLNEQANLPKLLERLKAGMLEGDEIIVVDGGSNDETLALCEKSDLKALKLNKGCRAIQMNYGARHSKGDILFFIHADTLPPESFRADIMKALEARADGGCFRYQFDSKSWLLKFNAFCTRFSPIFCRGGDQGLFIKRAVYDKLEGFAEDHRIMEDYEFIQRLRNAYNFKIIPKDFLVSARKYELNNYFRVQWANFLIFRAFFKGDTQENLIRTYRKWLRHPH